MLTATPQQRAPRIRICEVLLILASRKWSHPSPLLHSYCGRHFLRIHPRAVKRRWSKSALIRFHIVTTTTGRTSHVVGRWKGPTVPTPIPDQQSPCISLPSTGMKAMSRGSMAKSTLPIVSEIEAFVWQGTVQLPSTCFAPGIFAWIASTSWWYVNRERLGENKKLINHSAHFLRC